jgi:hypothetical protein
MTPKEFAEMLHGREYRSEITKEEQRIAADNGLVIVTGYSDDNMEFYGAFRDEVSCFDGGDAFIAHDDPFVGLIENRCDCDDCPYYKKIKQAARKITAVWYTEGYSWIYKTDIPHVTFDIVEGDDLYCRGIVFAVSDI